MEQMKKHSLNDKGCLAQLGFCIDSQGQKAHDGAEPKPPTPGQTPIKSPDTKKARLDPETVPEEETSKDPVNSPACQSLENKFHAAAAEDSQHTPASAACFEGGMCCRWLSEVGALQPQTLFEATPAVEEEGRLHWAGPVTVACWITFLSSHLRSEAFFGAILSGDEGQFLGGACPKP